MTQRKLGRTCNSVAISFYLILGQGLSGGLFSLALSEQYSIPPCGSPRLCLIASPVCLIIVFISLNKGLRYNRTATLSLVRNLDTVLAFVFQVVIFGRVPEVLSVIGACLIFAGTVTVTVTQAFGVTCGIEF